MRLTDHVSQRMILMNYSKHGVQKQYHIIMLNRQIPFVATDKNYKVFKSVDTKKIM